MKIKLLLSVVMLGSSLHATSASAEILVGVKAGLVDYDVPGSDAGVNGSFQIGAEVADLKFADVALEAEFSTSVVDPEVYNQDNSFESLGVYGSLRTAGPVYFIGRAGLVNAEIENYDDDTSLSMGLGIGFSAGLRWEIEYTTYEVEDVDVNYVTLGLSF
jgi:hypothetical protein